jgi:glycosyltransferase involved in cell wall biosynthesis
MKKIAIVVPSLFKTGGVTTVARFIKNTALRSDKYEIKLISLCMARQEKTSVEIFRPYSWLRGVTTQKGSWDNLPFTHVGAFLSEIEFQRYLPRRALTKLLLDCDLIQVVCGSPAWANSVLCLGKPVALQVATRAIIERRMRNNCEHGFLKLWRHMMTKITNQLDDRAIKRVDAIQVENTLMFKYAKKLNQDRDISVLYAPPGVDTSFFHPIRDRISYSPPYILCVGRLDDPRKNVNLLLEAYSLLPKTLKATVLLKVAGPFDPPKDFWQKVNYLGITDSVKHIKNPSENDLLKLYQHSKVFVLPSDEEGLGLVVLEAMACGIPVLSTRCGGPEEIITDSHDGLLIPLNDTKSLTSKLCQLIQDTNLNIQIGNAARQTVIEKYDELSTGNLFLKTWDHLLYKNETLYQGFTYKSSQKSSK